MERKQRWRGGANPLGHFTSVDGEPKCQIVIRKLFSFHSAADISLSSGDKGVCGWSMVGFGAAVGFRGK